MFTADKSASVGMQVWGHVGPRQMKMSHALFLLTRQWKVTGDIGTAGYSCSCFFFFCVRRLPLSPVLQVHGVERDREAPTDMFQQDTPYIQQ